MPSPGQLKPVAKCQACPAQAARPPELLAGLASEVASCAPHDRHLFRHSVITTDTMMLQLTAAPCSLCLCRSQQLAHHSLMGPRCIVSNGLSSQEFMMSADVQSSLHQAFIDVAE